MDSCAVLLSVTWDVGHLGDLRVGSKNGGVPHIWVSVHGLPCKQVLGVVQMMSSHDSLPKRLEPLGRLTEEHVGRVAVSWHLRVKVLALVYVVLMLVHHWSHVGMCLPNPARRGLIDKCFLSRLVPLLGAAIRFDFRVMSPMWINGLFSMHANIFDLRLFLLAHLIWSERPLWLLLLCLRLLKAIVLFVSARRLLRVSVG